MLKPFCEGNLKSGLFNQQVVYKLRTGTIYGFASIQLVCVEYYVFWGARLDLVSNFKCPFQNYGPGQFTLFAILLFIKGWHLLPASVYHFFTWPGGVLKSADKKGARDVLILTTMNLLALAPQSFYICSKSLFPPQSAPFQTYNSARGF